MTRAGGAVGQVLGTRSNLSLVYFYPFFWSYLREAGFVLTVDACLSVWFGSGCSLTCIIIGALLNNLVVFGIHSFSFYINLVILKFLLFCLYIYLLIPLFFSSLLEFCIDLLILLFCFYLCINLVIGFFFLIYSRSFVLLRSLSI